MKKISLALIMLIIVGICIPAVSADEIIIDETLSEFVDTSSVGQYYNEGAAYGAHLFDRIAFKNIALHPDLSYVIFTIDGKQGCDLSGNYLDNGVHSFTYTLNGQERPGHVYISRNTNAVGSVIDTRIMMFFDDWDIGDLQNRVSIPLSFAIAKDKRSSNLYYLGGAAKAPVWLHDANERSIGSTRLVKYSVASAIQWYNHLTVISDTNPDGYDINLERTVYNKLYSSKIEVLKSDNVIFTNFAHGAGFSVWFPTADVDKLRVTTPGDKVFDIPLSSPTDPTDPTEDPDSNSVTIYVRNSQTGAAIANSRCVIDALVDGDYYPVVNRTEPSGVFSVTLQPTGGGTPNPDGYRLIASADGYNNPMPEINFTVDEYTTSIYCYLDPIAGGPLDENKTFIDIFVRDMSANPISGATVNFGGYTLLTNSHGYTVFEVGKNATYTYTVSKSGYGSLTGNVVIGADSRHTINTVLAPAVTPTTQTPIPTGTAIGPTPTMTAPTGEPVSNWLEWFAAHLGMILGGGVEIGKIFMWLCFSVPVGVYVGKESKAGAAGFLAGAGIVTLFFVLIGWVPIWLLVLLALIIGLLYAKVFNSSDTGGGR